ncbi:MAG: HAD-IA family hydrolase [Flavobacteriaceae bacterium]|nr:HAD-IA family hydrolase [Flavobacteriaceae bacterium]
MIKTIIFDFGDVFINLDKEGAMLHALNLFKTDSFSDEMIATNNLYEKGLISTSSFIKFYKDCFPSIAETEIIETWNIIIRDFPKHRLEFLKTLTEEKKYTLILLSNTNELHIKQVVKIMNSINYIKFKNCFDKFYLSHEIHLSKPSLDIFQFVLDENSLLAKECLFVDDTKDHTIAAAQLGINTWNLNPKTEDITQLFEIKKKLF